MEQNETNNEIERINDWEGTLGNNKNALDQQKDSILFGLINQVKRKTFVCQTRDHRGSILENYLKQVGRLTSLQKEVLIGILLGDATLRVGGTARNCNLKYDQRIENADLVHLIYLIFEPFVGTPPTIRYKDGKEHSLWFRTFRLPDLFFYYGQFYTLDAHGQRTRGVPRLLHRWITPISLAFWFMDDGSKVESGYVIHTESFFLSDCKYLQQVLGKKFGLEVTIQKDVRVRTYYKLYIQASSREKFTQLVRPYILPCMQYKLHS